VAIQVKDFQSSVSALLPPFGCQRTHKERCEFNKESRRRIKKLAVAPSVGEKKAHVSGTAQEFFFSFFFS